MAKVGPRAKRIAARDAIGALQRSFEHKAREQLAPIMKGNARTAVANFRRQAGR